MIAFLNGTLVDKKPTCIVLDVNGVGYEVSIPLSSYDRLPPRGDMCRILTHDYVREDTHQLFGFMTEEERRLFALLLGASGIGPRLALSALSGLSVRELKAAVVSSDVKRLSSISGIGKKMAERIVVELRDKIGEGEALEALAGDDVAVEGNTRLRDAMLALTALGYKPHDARKMVLDTTKAGETADMTVEQIIRRSLGG